MWLIELFRAVEQALGKREIIAEDLGYMSETVRQLVRDSGFPGMKVLEFAFDSRDTGSASDYLPHNYPVNSVAYTGTHDNETLVSWYQTVTDAERAMVRDYLYDYATPEEQLYKSMIALILRSAAAACIIPMDDKYSLWTIGIPQKDYVNQLFDRVDPYSVLFYLLFVVFIFEQVLLLSLFCNKLSKIKSRTLYCYAQFIRP